MLEVILKKDIFKLGERGDVVRVANGYARNYLYPQRLAIPADKGSLQQLSSMRAAADRQAVTLRGDAERQLAALEGVEIRVVARASLNNQLYGSVKARDIAAKLEEIGIELDRNRIQLKSPIRILGDYEVPIHIYKDLACTIKLEVRAEGREDDPLTRSMEAPEQLEFAPAPEPEEGEEGEEGEGFDSEGQASAEESDEATEAAAAGEEAAPAGEEAAAAGEEAAAAEEGEEVWAPPVTEPAEDQAGAGEVL